MQPGTTPLRQLVKQEVPEQFLYDVVLLLLGVYQSTYEQIDSEFESTGEGIDLLPIYRRARIENGLRDIATRYRVDYENMTIRPARNEANNCWHNEIICNRILLTQSHVKRYDEMESFYTAHLIRRQNIQLLFD